MTMEERMETLERRLAGTRKQLAVVGLIAVVGIVVASWRTAATTDTTATVDTVATADTASAASDHELGMAKEVRTQVLIANKLIIEDENGEKRVVIWAVGDGSDISCYYKGGERALWVRALGDGPDINCYYKGGESALWMLLDPKFGPSLTLNDGTGRIRACLSAEDANTTTLLLADKGSTKGYFSR